MGHKVSSYVKRYNSFKIVWVFAVMIRFSIYEIKGEVKNTPAWPASPRRFYHIFQILPRAITVVARHPGDEHERLRSSDHGA